MCDIKWYDIATQRLKRANEEAYARIWRTCEKCWIVAVIIDKRNTRFWFVRLCVFRLSKFIIVTVSNRFQYVVIILYQFVFLIPWIFFRYKDFSTLFHWILFQFTVSIWRRGKGREREMPIAHGVAILTMKCCNFSQHTQKMEYQINLHVMRSHISYKIEYWLRSFNRVISYFYAPKG